MKRIVLAALCLLAIGSLQAAELFAERSLDLAREAALARAEGKALAVAFELSDCPYCEAMRRDIYRQAEVSDYFQERNRTLVVELGGNAPLLTPDGRQLATDFWARSLGIHGTPAFAFFDGEGQLLTRYSGAFKTPQDFIGLGQYVHTTAYEERPFRLAQPVAADPHQGHAPKHSH